MSRLPLILILAIGIPARAAMDFNGSSNYVKIDEAIPSSFPWTISFWFRTTATVSTKALFYVASTASTTPLIWISRLGTSDLSTAPCDVAGHARMKIRSTDPSCDINICLAKVINDGNWHFFAVRATSASAFSIKVDDVANTGSDPDCVSFPATDRTAIGGRFRAVADFLDDADIDDVRVYDRALSDAELESLHLSRSRLANTDGLLAYWPLNEGVDGTNAVTAFDRSGNGKHLTATASPVYEASDNLRYP